MSEADQIKPYPSNTGHHSREVVYVPPNPKLVAELARQACNQLGKQDPTFNNPEVLGGLSSYLTFMSQLLATYANKGRHVLKPNLTTVDPK